MAISTWSLTVVVVAVASCIQPAARVGEQPARQALSDGGVPPCPTGAATCVPVSTEAELDGGCPDERWIAIASAPANPCPLVNGGAGGSWASSKLFDLPGAQIPPGLRAYCLYEWVPSDPDAPAPADVAQLVQVDGQVTTRARDCAAVGLQGDSAAVDAGWRTLQSEYHLQVGRPASLPRAAAVPPAAVRVAVVDSTPTGYRGGVPGDDRSGHGNAVGWIIREHACPTPASPTEACIGQIADHLALPHLTPRVRDPATGGYFGFQTELARAIHAAVNDWRAAAADGGAQPRMVVNLSVAWDSLYGGDYAVPADLAPPVRAVHAAITHAACQGTLVIAAAGNDPGGPATPSAPQHPSGPMYPAGWETKPAPAFAECQAMEGAGYPPEPYPVLPPPDAGVYQPLVFAAGGVRGDDEPLANARPAGRPRLAAPGAQAVAEDTGVPTSVLTGTSAAAAATSAVAATVWGYRPSLTAPEVMDLVRQSGARLGVPADFCLGGLSCPWSAGDPRREIVRANQCEAIRMACGGGLERCPPAAALPSCAPRPAHAGTTPALSPGEVAEVEAHVTRTASGGGLLYDLPPLPVCRHHAFRTALEAYPSTVCPNRQFFEAPMRPWTGPQPGSNPCPVCLLMVDAAAQKGTAYLSIDSDFSTGSLAEPILRVNDWYDIDLSSAGSLLGGDVVKVTDIDLSGMLPVESATISFRMPGASDFSTTSELLVQ